MKQQQQVKAKSPKVAPCGQQASSIWVIGATISASIGFYQFTHAGPARPASLSWVRLKWNFLEFFYWHDTSCTTPLKTCCCPFQPAPSSWRSQLATMSATKLLLATWASWCPCCSRCPRYCRSLLHRKARWQGWQEAGQRQGKANRGLNVPTKIAILD